jgi:hypothetical protein
VLGEDCPSGLNAEVACDSRKPSAVGVVLAHFAGGTREQGARIETGGCAGPAMIVPVCVPMRMVETGRVQRLDPAVSLAQDSLAQGDAEVEGDSLQP